MSRRRFLTNERIGDYHVERELESEETGVVYHASHVVLPRRVAIKVIHASQAGLKSMAIQMLREACILEALSHPGVPRIYECGVLPDKRPWVALELVEGDTLDQVMTFGPLAVADLAPLLRDLATVIEHAHSRGVVHHRISEQHVVRTPERTFPLVIRNWGSVSTHDSRHSAEPSSDVHALGALAFRALTGSLLMPSASAQEQCPSAPRELTSLIDDMLEPDPQSRPSIAEVRARAAWLADTLQVVTPPKPRWTPPRGMRADRMPTVVDEPIESEFKIRIRRA
jgi:serine/threonine protein kinase